MAKIFWIEIICLLSHYLNHDASRATAYVKFDEDDLLPGAYEQLVFSEWDCKARTKKRGPDM